MQKLLEKYKNLSEPVKASFWFFLCGVLQKGITVITTPIFTRVLDTAEYGAFSVYTSWQSILSVFVTLNLSAGVFTRGLVKNDEDKDRFTASFYGLSTVLVLVNFIIYLIFRSFFNEIFNLTTPIMVCMFLTMWAGGVFSFWSARQRVEYRYRAQVALTLTVSVVQPIIGLLSIYLFPSAKVEARIISITVVSLLAYSWLGINHIRKGRSLYNGHYWSYALKFNIPLVPHYLSQNVLSASDRIMINKYCTTSDAGIYSLAYSLSMLMTIVNTAINNTFSPWLYKCIKEKQFQNIGKISYMLLGLIAVGNLCVIAVTPEIVAIFAPPQYAAAIWAIPPVTLTVFFMFMYTMFANFSFYFAKTNAIAITSCLGAVLNVVLNMIFIPVFGYIAAAYTTLICYVCYTLAHYVLMRRIVKEYLDDVRIYSQTILCALSVVFVLLGFGIMMLYEHTIMRYLFILLTLLVVVSKRKKIMVLLQSFKG